jgi:hypothetical protein
MRILPEDRLNTQTDAVHHTEAATSEQKYGKGINFFHIFVRALTHLIFVTMSTAFPLTECKALLSVLM